MRDERGRGHPVIDLEQEPATLGRRLHARYRAWVEDYARYARMRGFTTEINDWPYVRRSFLECWAEAGFHRFWQVWNPGISYFVYRLFLRFGGRRRWVVPTLLAFFVNGLIHNMAGVLLVGHWSVMFVVTFTCCGVLTVLSRYLAPILHQRRWPKALNTAVNVALVIASFDLGFRVDGLLCTIRS
jgi:D-alanyl-lipoteichoic acid acyltransferase DltB (MBOAT superfamily)